MEDQKTINKRQPKQKKQKTMKVVYISNPVKVQASASKFRDVVQELTGRYSDIGDALGFSYVADDAPVAAESIARDTLTRDQNNNSKYKSVEVFDEIFTEEVLQDDQ